MITTFPEKWCIRPNHNQNFTTLIRSWCTKNEKRNETNNNFESDKCYYFIDNTLYYDGCSKTHSINKEEYIKLSQEEFEQCVLNEKIVNSEILFEM